jgi:Fe-S cluster assembly protein SufD
MVGWTRAMVNVASIDHYRQQFQHAKPNFVATELLEKRREQALEQFLAAGFPTRRDEDWKYLNLHQLSQQGFVYNPTQAVTTEPSTIPLDCYQLCIQDGQVIETEQYPDSFKASVQLYSLRDLLIQAPAWWQDYVAELPTAPHALAALNQAFMQDGYVVVLAAGVCLDKPLLIQHKTTSTQFVPRSNFIIAAEGSQATIIEHYVGQSSYFVNTQTDCLLKADAHLQHYKIIAESSAGYHIGLTQATQCRNSQFSSFSFALSGALVRSDTRSVLTEPKASCAFYGLSLACQNEVFDHHTIIEHAADETQSNEFYKAVAAHHAQIVFNGKIRVPQGVKKINSEQQNRNLLLSSNAEIDSKPELEIFADDVKCSHGAAIGELDQAALFYLQSRGIALPDARQLLLNGFIKEIMHKVNNTNLKSWLFLLHHDKLQQLEASYD